MLKDLVMNSRSYRGYDESYVLSKEDLEALVDITRYCPSTMNKQPLKYYIAYQKEEVEAILALTKWAGALPELHLPYEGCHPIGFIIICQDLNIHQSMSTFSRDAGIVGQTMLLAVCEKGLGGLMIGSFQKDGLKALLKLPDNIDIHLVLAIGKPKENIVLTDVLDNQTNYYRDENNTHYVPKRSLNDIIIKK
ncbi:MAG: nitroreductase family protein [Erysipelotrichaceae bacterium]|nr:nitroreductase family protein [Erysipelotrichaceae bacterium]